MQKIYSLSFAFFSLVMTLLNPVSPLRAAIITERNDLFLYLPDYATFRGTSYAPGIDSCWIPYGTYTGGSGSTEYTRVTSNLVGVVYSAYDGLFERDSDRYKDPWNLYWRNHFPSNSTMRVFDWLNRGHYGEEKTIEEVLAFVEIENDEWWHPGAGQGYYHRGILHNYGSRALDALTGNTAPPIATSWSETLPFRAEDSNVWVNVFPSFDSLLYDSHIWVAPTNADVRPRYSHGAVQDHWYAGFWSSPSDFESVVGEDFEKSANALAEVLWSIPTPFTIEDVLSYDTGWKYNHPPVETNSYWMVNGQKLSLHYDEKDDYGWVLKRWWSDELFEDEYGEYELNIVYDNGTAPNWSFYKYYFGYNPYLAMLWEGQDEGNLDFMDGYDSRTGQDYVAYRISQYDDADDYVHWRNMTTRLDWKRLGIICQFERQSEITMWGGAEGYLPFLRSEATRRKGFEAQYSVPSLTIPDSGPGTVLASVTTSDLAWTQITNSITNVVSKIGICYPSARLTIPSLDGIVTPEPIKEGNIPLYFPDDNMRWVIEAAVNSAVGSDISTMTSATLYVSGPCSLSTAGNEVIFKMTWVDVTEAGGRIWSYYQSPEFRGSATGLTVSNLVITYRQDIKKTSLASYTRCEPQERIEVITNMIANYVIAPYSNEWNHIAFAEPYAWEIMVDAKGSGISSLASSLDRGRDYCDEYPFKWDELLQLSRTGVCECTRQFRLAPSLVRASSFRDFAEMWLNSWLRLDAEVKERMSVVGGVDIMSAAERTDIGDDEVNRVQSRYDEKLDVTHFIELACPQSATVYVSAYVSVVSGAVDSVEVSEFGWFNPERGSWETFPHTPDGWEIAHAGFVSEGTSASVDLTVDNPPARVDAHQSPLSRVIMRFKNLRNPNL